MGLPRKGRLGNESADYAVDMAFKHRLRVIDISGKGRSLLFLQEVAGNGDKQHQEEVYRFFQHSIILLKFKLKVTAVSPGTRI